jgi:hypothetical protein
MLARHRRSTRIAMGSLAAALATLVSVAAIAVEVGPAGAASSAATTQAKKDLLKLSDMPAGWTAQKSSDDGGAIPGASRLAKCLGIPLSVIIGVPPTAYSEQFTSKDDLENADDNVTFYKSAAAAQADYQSLSSTKAPACLATDFNGPAKAQLQSEFGSSAKIGSVDVARAPASAFGPGVTNVTLFFPVTMKGTTLNVELIIADYITGTKEQTTEFIGVQSPVPSSLTKRLTTIADKRI